MPFQTLQPQKVGPVSQRDFHGGRYAAYAISNALTPPYTVSDSLNVNFDTVIGSVVVRPGTTIISTVSSLGAVPQGTANFLTKKGTIYNRIVLANTGKVFYYNGSWHTSNLTNLSTTNKVRFSMLGNQMFLVNGVVMKSSSDGAATWGTTNCTTIAAGIIIRAKARLLASGVTTTGSSPSRVYFSSVVDPTQSPGTITWNTNASTGDWIDINPDDGDSNTAFANTSTFTLVFKNYAMYRLDVINKSVDPDNIFNLGTPSQEAVASCQGLIYFFTGVDIRSTSGDFPIQISRLGVQDFIDAIPQANWGSVTAGTDGISVWFSIGTVTLNTARNESRTYTNVKLKFSPRDQSWSVHSYANNFQSFTNITTTGVVGIGFIGADTSGNVQYMNVGTSDNTKPIFFEATTQDVDFGNRSHRKTMSNQAVFFTKDGANSSVVLLPDDKDPVVIPSAKNLVSRVTIADSINVSFNYVKFKWFGSTSTSSPRWEGFTVEDVTDDGIVN